MTPASLPGTPANATATSQASRYTPSRRTSRDALLRHDLPHLWRAPRPPLRGVERLRWRTRNTHHQSTPGDAVTFLDELYLVGTLTDDHDTEYDGGHYITPSILRDDGK